MVLSVSHNFSCGIADDPASQAAGEILPSHWNDTHAVTGTLPVADLDASGLTNNRLIYTASGLLSSASLLAYATSGDILTVTAGAIADVPLTLAPFSASQTGNLLEVLRADGTVSVQFRPENAAPTGLVRIGHNGLSAGTGCLDLFRGGNSSGNLVFRVVAGDGTTVRASIDGEGAAFFNNGVSFGAQAFTGTINHGGSPRIWQAVNSSDALQIRANGQTVIHTTTSASLVPVTVRGAASQTANLQEWQNSAGGNLTCVTAGGDIKVGSGGNFYFSNGGRGITFVSGDVTTASYNPNHTLTGDSGGRIISTGTSHHVEQADSTNPAYSARCYSISYTSSTIYPAFRSQAYGVGDNGGSAVQGTAGTSAGLADYQLQGEVRFSWVSSTSATRTGRVALGAYYTSTYQQGLKVEAHSSGVASVTIEGALSLPITTVSADTTLDTAHYTVLVDASGANRTITLPAASSSAGRIYNVKKIDSSANTVTIDGNASETIDGATTQVLTIQWQSAQLQCNGTAWFMV